MSNPVAMGYSMKNEPLLQTRNVTCGLLLLAVLWFASESFAAPPCGAEKDADIVLSVKQERYSLCARNAPIDSVLASLSTQTGALIDVSGPQNQTVNLHVTSVSLTELFKLLGMNSVFVTDDDHRLIRIYTFPVNQGSEAFSGTLPPSRLPDVNGTTAINSGKLSVTSTPSVTSTSSVTSTP